MYNTSRVAIRPWFSHSLELGNPNCAQTTLASESSHRSSQTVPQTLLLQNSTRPSVVVPARRLISPWVQLLVTLPEHLTPASSVCLQSCCPSGLAGQSISLVSLPLHATSSNQIWPSPAVNQVSAVAPIMKNVTLVTALQLWDHNFFSLTCARQLQLYTDDSGIWVIPLVITHCAPDIVVADLHAPWISGSRSSQSEGSLSASWGSYTPHPSICSMPTASSPQGISRTVNESALCSNTSYIVQPDLTSTIGEALSQGLSTCTYKY